jgi:predicted  nucleic acid-binding Zn-ribbon protein
MSDPTTEERLGTAEAERDEARREARLDYQQANDMTNAAALAVERAVSAEQRVAELENKLDKDSQNFELECRKAQLEIAEARIAELEAALREIEVSGHVGPNALSREAFIARRALATSEQAEEGA